MKVSQIMSLYELYKRDQAKGHILGDGIRAATFKTRQGKKLSDTGHMLTPEDQNKLFSTLTKRQIEVADNLQKYMQEQGGAWGNQVSMARFGEKQFGEENYFPINSDGRHLDVNAEESPKNASLYALLNMGFTKECALEFSMMSGILALLGGELISLSGSVSAVADWGLWVISFGAPLIAAIGGLLLLKLLVKKEKSYLLMFWSAAAGVGALVLNFIGK